MAWYSYFARAIRWQYHDSRSARRAAVRSLLERAFDGAFGPLFKHLVAEEKLSGKERQELARMLDELDRPPPRRGRT